MRYLFKGATRALRRAPGFAITSSLLLAVAFTVVGIAFEVVQSVLLAPLPYPQPDRLVRIWETNFGKGIRRSPVSRGNFFDWRDSLKSFEAVEAFANPRDTVLQFDGGRPEMLRQVPVSRGFLGMMRTPPLRGRIEDGASVLHHRFWARRFPGDADLVAHTYTIQGFPDRPKAVTAVMPPEFDFPARADQWTTLAFGTERSVRDLNVVARLRGGVSLDAARAELTALESVLEADHPQDNSGWRAEIVPLKETIVAGSKPVLAALAVAVCVLAAIAVSSVSAMLVAHLGRARFDDAIRLALGGTPRHVVAQHATEICALTSMAMLIALGVSSLALPALAAASSDLLPRSQEITWNRAVVVAMGAMWLSVTAILLACHLGGATSRRPSMARRRSTASGRAVRVALVAGQVALCVVLLTVCASVVTHFLARANATLGFSTDAVTSAQVRLPIRVAGESTAYYPTERFAATADLLLDRTAQNPRFVASAIAWHVPSITFDGQTTFAVLDGPRTGPVPAAPSEPSRMAPCAFNVVSPGYFETAQIRRLAGRTFSPDDRWTPLQLQRDYEPRGPGAAIVSHALVRAIRLTPEQALHRYLAVDSASAPSVEIVGVVADVRDPATGLTEPTVYLPFAQLPTASFAVLTRSLEGREGGRELDALLNDVGGGVWAFDIVPLELHVSRKLSLVRFGAVVVSALGLVASIVAVAALLSLVSFVAATRRWELALRVAFGAATSDLMHTLVRDGLRSATLGAVFGAGAAALLGQTSAVILPDGFAITWPTILVVALGAFAASTVVLYVPAWRASHIDPVSVLKAE